LTLVTEYVTSYHARSFRDVFRMRSDGATAVPAGGVANFPRAALGIMPPAL
jgi:hypothetical protein